jgi:isopentenyl diphosphate isomerase/L-lactate dehydrogenase-like FMN-dependent dehydrogenase
MRWYMTTPCEIEVVMDGGVRRGSDVVKALAFGARAVMVGRAYLWGLAANGQAGVENVLDVLRMGIDSALLGMGKASISELSPADLYVPRDFCPLTGDHSDRIRPLPVRMNWLDQKASNRRPLRRSIR